MSGLAIMQRRIISSGSDVRVQSSIQGGVEDLVRLKVLAMARSQVVRKRPPSSARYAVAPGIPGRIENATRPPTFSFPLLKILNERVLAAIRNIEVGKKVPNGVEKPVGPSTICPTVPQIM